MKKLWLILLVLPSLCFGWDYWGAVYSPGATAYIVASNANDIEQYKKFQNVYYCDGTGDDREFQDAIDALETTGGRLGLSDGLFSFTNQPVIDSIQYLEILGMGMSSQIKFTTEISSLLGANGSIGDDTIQVASTAGIVAGMNVAIDDDDSDTEAFVVTKVIDDTLLIIEESDFLSTIFGDTLGANFTTAQNAELYVSFNGFVISGDSKHIIFRDFYMHGNNRLRTTLTVDASMTECGLLFYETPYYCLVENVRIDSLENYPIHFARGHQSDVVNCLFFNNRAGGVYLCINNDGNYIAGNKIIGGVIGISTGGQTNGCRVIGNYISGSQVGIKTYTGVDIQIIGNDIASCTNYGIQVQDTTTRFIVNENTIHGCSRQAIFIQDACDDGIVSKNIMTNNGGSTELYGIELEGNVDNVWITNNIMLCHASCDTGILIGANATNIHVIRNDLQDYDEVGIGDLSGAADIQYNTGFITEASGIDTVADDATSVEITHGLSFTPTLDDITITPEVWGDATKYWVLRDSIEAAVFDVTISGDPGATGFIFSWSIENR